MVEYDSEKIHEIMGGMNYHISISFIDGEDWICRIRRSNASSPPQELQDAILLCEVATLHYLSRFTKVPVPKIHGYALAGADNPVGVSYVLMEKLHGHPAELEEATAEQQQRFMDQFADLFAELSRPSFSAIGCLEPSEDDATIGPLVIPRMADCKGGDLVLPGPFTTAAAYRRDVLQTYLELIRKNELYAGQRVDAYLVHRFLLDNLPALEKADAQGNGAGRFYLKHMDDKGDHILVDDDFNIVGIIDWEWAQTVPMAEAFASPLFMLDVGAYYSGDDALSAIEQQFVDVLEKKGHAALAALVRAGRVQHRLSHCIGGDLEDPDFHVMFVGLLKLLGVGGDVSWDEWREDALARYGEEIGEH